MGLLRPSLAPSWRSWRRGSAVPLALLLSLLQWRLRAKLLSPPTRLPEPSTAPERTRGGRGLWAAAPQRRAPYIFFDAGGAYHDTNYSCPVTWAWTSNSSEAHVVWHTVLDNLPVGPPRGPLPRAFPGQRFAFMSLESEAYYPVMNNLRFWGYDFVVDYRIWDDDVTAPSGAASDGASAGPVHIPAVYLTNPTAPGFTIDFRRPPPRQKRRDAVMAAFVSNCGALSGRGALLEALSAALPVHSYGKCARNAEEPPAPPGVDKFRAKEALAAGYHFLFAAENSVRRSYVSEKVYSALAAGAVPVYLGAPDVGRFVPRPSAIVNAADFASPAALAAYLADLSEDDEKYAAHFRWKQEEFSPDFKRVLRLAARTVQCRVAMALEGLDFEADLADLELFPRTNTL